MGFRFRKSIKIFPSILLNLSKRGASISIGPRGLKYTVGPKGSRLTAGIPGTGLSWTEFSPNSAPHSPTTTNGTQFKEAPSVVPAESVPLMSAESASLEQARAVSTDELASIPDAVHPRIRMAPLVLIICIILFVVALLL
jgi:Protein of unknown function (DUF4236)